MLYFAELLLVGFQVTGVRGITGRVADTGSSQLTVGAALLTAGDVIAATATGRLPRCVCRCQPVVPCLTAGLREKDSANTQPS